MTQATTISVAEVSFKDFLFKNKRNKNILILAALAAIVQILIFKYFYPYPNFISGDSYVYIETADKNLDIHNYMVGYSRFLRLFSSFTSSDLAIVIFQYFFIQLSGLLLIFSISYFYNPGKAIQIILLSIFIFNPLALHLGNLISSDGYFLALSLIWFTLLIWIIHRPTNKLIILHTLVLFIAFTVRYNALIYPLIALIAFGLSNIPTKKKILGLFAGVIVCSLFVGYTTYKFKQLTNHWQYSPFSGWQLANNAMYTYRYVDSAEHIPVPKKFAVLDNMIRQYFDTTKNILRFPHEAQMAGTVYMWSPGLPLQKYMNAQFQNDSLSNLTKRWATMGPQYGQYGIWIITHYPKHFARYFLWPNANKYYAPPVEYLENYNMGSDSIGKIAQKWFQFKSGKVFTRTKDFEVKELNFFPILTGTMNAMYFCTLLCFILLKGFQIKSLFRQSVILFSSVWMFNALFTIFASSVALRFQSFPILLVTTYSLLLLDWMIKFMASQKTENLRKIENVQDGLNIQLH